MHSELVTDVALQESFPLLGKHNQALQILYVISLFLLF